MKSWEEIVKDRLEGYESPLPEGSLAEFRSLRDSLKPKARKKALPFAWAAAAVAAAAAAAIVFISRPQTPEEAIQVVRQPVVAQSVPKAARPLPADSLGSATPVLTAHRIPQAVIPQAVPALRAEVADAQENVAPESVLQENNDIDSTVSPAEEVSPVIPQAVIPARKNSGKVGIKVVPAVGSVVGGGLVAALASNLHVGFGRDLDVNYNAGQSDTHHNASPDDKPTPPQNLLTGYKHSAPLTAGLSVRYPVSRRLGITSGLDYTLYSSKISYSQTGDVRQQVHCLGVPVRLDWTLASGRLLDVYIGGGVKADYCIKATLDGNKIKRDATGFSLLGAGGIQLNMTPRAGLYLEPRLSWTANSEDFVLETYRTDKPLMFSVAGGLRINLGKQTQNR